MIYCRWWSEMAGGPDCLLQCSRDGLGRPAIAPSKQSLFCKIKNKYHLERGSRRIILKHLEVTCLWLLFQNLVRVKLCICVCSPSFDWVSSSLRVWSGFTGTLEKSGRIKMRQKAWWKRFILGSHLITCIQSSLQCPQPSSADAVLLSFFSPLTPLS